MAFVRKARTASRWIAPVLAGMLFTVSVSATPQRTPPRDIPRAKPSTSPAAASGAQSSQIKYKGIWEPISYPDDVHFFDTFFATADEGWVAGGTNEVTGGIILHTSDGGDRWDVQYGDPQSSERAVSELRFLDQTHGWAVQRTGSTSPLLHTRDGKLWVVAGTIDENHKDYMFTSETTGSQLSADVIKITLDGGRTWKPVFPSCEWRRLQFVTPSIAYAAAKSYDARTELFLAKTTDGGAPWSMITQELTDYPEDAFFVDSNTGYVRVGYPAQPQLAARWFPGRHADASAGAGAAAVVPSTEEHQGSVVGGGNGDEYSRTGQRALTDGALGVPESKVRFWRSAGRGLP